MDLTDLDVMYDIEGMMSIFVEASEARDSLNDDRELVHTFEVCQFPRQFLVSHHVKQATSKQWT